MKGRRRLGGLRMGCGEGLVSRLALRFRLQRTELRRHGSQSGTKPPGGER